MSITKTVSLDERYPHVLKVFEKDDFQVIGKLIENNWYTSFSSYLIDKIHEKYIKSLEPLLQQDSEAVEGANDYQTEVEERLIKIQPLLKLNIAASPDKYFPVAEQIYFKVIEAKNIELIKLLHKYEAPIPDIAVERAIYEQNFELVKLLVELGAPINNPSIIIAAEVNSFDILRYLAKGKTNFDYGFEYSVAYAAGNNNIEMVKFLLDIGAPLSETAIAYAVGDNHFEMVEFLLAQGASIGIDAIAYAAGNNNLEMVKLLLDKGAPIGEGAIVFAASNNHFEMVEFLLGQGAPMVTKAIDGAASNNHLDMVEFLLKKGAHLSENAIDHAIFNKHYDMVEFLLRLGSPLDASLILKAASNNDIEMIKLLLKYGATITEEAVGYAAADNHLELAEFLLDNEAPINEQAITYAVDNNNIEMVNLLLEHCTEKLTDNIATRIAVRNNNLEMLKLLLEYKAPINMITIIDAEDYGYNEIADFLSAYNAPPGLADIIISAIERDDPLVVRALLSEQDIFLSKDIIELAKEKNNPEIIELLDKHLASLRAPNLEKANNDVINKVEEIISIQPLKKTTEQYYEAKEEDTYIEVTNQDEAQPIYIACEA